MRERQLNVWQVRVPLSLSLPPLLSQGPRHHEEATRDARAAAERVADAHAEREREADSDRSYEQRKRDLSSYDQCVLTAVVSFTRTLVIPYLRVTIVY